MLGGIRVAGGIFGIWLRESLGEDTLDGVYGLQLFLCIVIVSHPGIV